MGECDKYPAGSRRRAICGGTADLPPTRLDAMRASLGVTSASVVHVPAKHSPQTAVRVYTRTAAGLVASPVTAVVHRKQTYGAGSELLKKYAAAGVPSCQACIDLAEKMDVAGTAWCRENLDWIVAEIMPRAKEWVAAKMPWTHALLPGCVEDIGIRMRVRSDVLDAIEQAEKNPAPPPAAKKNESPSVPLLTPQRHVVRVGHRPANVCPPLPEPPPIAVTTQDVVDRCEVVVKSFRRHNALDKFLRSLWARYPGLPVLIADDSFAAGEKPPALVETIRSLPNVRWFQMPFDSGLSAGRNLCVREATRDIILLADDDYVVTEETRLERLLAVLDARSDVSLVAGCIRNGVGLPVTQWAGHMKLTSNSMIVEPLASAWRRDGGIRNRDADLTWNFFAARRGSLLSVPWDDRLKIAGEHVDFFMSRKKAGERSAFTDEVVIVHEKQHPAGYSQFRNRTAKFYDLMQKKWGLKRVGSPHPMRLCGETP
jgi:GT2 family glycosyltransferase